MKRILLSVFVLSFFSLQLFASNEKEAVKKLKNKFATTAVKGHYGQANVISYLYNIGFFDSDKSASLETDSVPDFKTEFEYNNNIIEGVMSSWENDTWNKMFKFILYARSEFETDSIFTLEYDKATSDWVPRTKQTTEFDGEVIKRENIFVADSATGRWDLFLKTEMEYNDNGFLIRELGDIYVADSGKFLPMSKDEYFVSDSGQEDSTINYYWIRGETANFWMQNSKTYFFYDADGISDYDISFMWNYISWEKDTKSNFLFNQNGDMYLQTDSIWAETQWVASSEDSTVYTDDAEPLVEISKQWVESENRLLVHDKSYYTYDPKTAVITDLLESNLSVFPNPASDFITIELDKPHNASVQLFDVTGKLVLQQNLNAPSTTISMEHIRKGNCIVRIKNDNKVESHVLIIN